jgi:hypothetical protein
VTGAIRVARIKAAMAANKTFQQPQAITPADFTATKIDRADAAALVRANRDSLDWDYLARWARELAVTDDLAQARNDAFPSGPGVQ